MDIDLDLDLLKEPTKRVKINGRVIEVKYPSMAQFAEIISLASQFENLGKNTENSEDKSAELFLKLNDVFKRLIPEVEQELTITQIMALIQLYSDFDAPEEYKKITPLEESATKKKLA